MVAENLAEAGRRHGIAARLAFEIDEEEIVLGQWAFELEIG